MPTDEWNSAFGQQNETPFGGPDDPRNVMGATTGMTQDHGVQDAKPNYEVIPVGSNGIAEADSMHNMMEQLLREKTALERKLAVLQAPAEVTSPSLGGPPMPHHLHLVDGRVIPNHVGTGTHYSEVLPDGTERVTRIKEYFPVNEPHPVNRFA